jgi:hypothetical protein
MFQKEHHTTVRTKYDAEPLTVEMEVQIITC